MMSKDVWNGMYNFIERNHLENVKIIDNDETMYMWKVIINNINDGNGEVSVCYLYGTDIIDISLDVWVNGNCRQVEITSDLALKLRGIES